MSIKSILIGVLLFLTALPVSAQSKDCGSGLPCGPLPWKLPVLPTLASPTPAPTTSIAATASPSGTQQATPPAAIVTAIPPPTVDLDTGGIDDSFATLSAIMASTPLVVLNTEGTPVGPVEDLDANASVFFSYAKGMTTDWAGPIAPLITLTMTAFVTVVGVKIITFILPLLSAIFGIIRKIISLILDFLPF